MTTSITKRELQPPLPAGDCPATVLHAGRQRYERDGFCTLPRLLPADLIAQVPSHMQAVLDGRFETGIAPMWKPAESATKVRIIDQPHVADRTLFQLISQPVIGQAAAAVTGARKIQVWAVSLIYKPPGGVKHGGIGWHQDWQYWDTMWEDGSEVLTAWLACSDVTEEAGAVRFVPGSQRWGLLKQGDLDNPDQAPVVAPAGETWREVSALLAPGAFSLHHPLTYHGSGPNNSTGPRLGFALHLCTENSRPRPLTQDNPGREYLKDLPNPGVCPVIYDATKSSLG